MNEYERLTLDCRLGIKAYQNLVGSCNALSAIARLHPLKDNLLLSSIFCFAVTKYAKPFVETSTRHGKKTYPVRTLKTQEGFSMSMHNHLIEVRHSLVAHDDLKSIEPKILQGCFKVRGSSLAIPVTIGLSNKCISYPESIETIEQMRTHVLACTHGVLEKTQSDITMMRKLGLKKPELAESGAKYHKDFGTANIAADGTMLNPPDFMSDAWLNTGHPDFSNVHNGYVYEELRIRKDFYGPETIDLPEGGRIELSPPQSHT